MIKNKTEKMYEIQVITNPEEKVPKYKKVCIRTNIKSARKYVSSVVGKPNTGYYTGYTSVSTYNIPNFTFKREHFRIVRIVTNTTQEIEVVE